jgi:thioredoxin reductase (NADPH)
LTAQGATEVLPADVVVASLGLSPRLGPLADWGLALERKQLPVQTDTFSTHESGIFAVGDINTYPGKKKLILCGFHEATLAAFGAAALLNPAQKTPLQYTTTSTLLHQRLGIA